MNIWTKGALFLFLLFPVNDVLACTIWDFLALIRLRKPVVSVVIPFRSDLNILEVLGSGNQGTVYLVGNEKERAVFKVPFPEEEANAAEKFPLLQRTDRNVTQIAMKVGDEFKTGVLMPIYSEYSDPNLPAKSVEKRMEENHGVESNSFSPYHIFSEKIDPQNQDPQVQKYSQSFIFAILDGMKKLHDKKIIFHDFSWKNVLIREGPDGFEVRYIDFDHAEDLHYALAREDSVAPLFPIKDDVSFLSSWLKLGLGFRLNPAQKLILQLELAQDIPELKKLLLESKKTDLNNSWEKKVFFEKLAVLFQREMNRDRPASKKETAEQRERRLERLEYYRENQIQRLLNTEELCDPLITAIKAKDPTLGPAIHRYDWRAR